MAIEKEFAGPEGINVGALGFKEDDMAKASAGPTLSGILSVWLAHLTQVSDCACPIAESTCCSNFILCLLIWTAAQQVCRSTQKRLHWLALQCPICSQWVGSRVELFEDCWRACAPAFRGVCMRRMTC